MGWSIQSSMIFLVTVILTCSPSITGTAGGSDAALPSALSSGRRLLAIPAFEAYIGVNGSSHQANIDRLVAQGYRIITLSVYGDPGKALYAAVWVKRGGPAWAAIHGINSTQYQAKLDQMSSQGYVPLILSVTGTTASNAVFAGTFEQRNVTGWVAKFGLTDGAVTDSATLQGQNKLAFENTLVIRCASIYGDTANRLYAAIWEPSVQMRHWILRPHDTAAGYKFWYYAYKELPYRPSFVTLSGGEEFLSIFKDDTIGPWVAKEGLTGAEYQAEFNLHTGHGYYPICVQGGGSSADPRYAVLFAKQDTPNSKVWTVTGTVTPGLEGFDGVMRRFMRGHGVHAGQLSIARNGTLRYARAFTYAEPGYQITQPSTLMRIAQVTNAFTLAAIQKLLDDKLLMLSTSVFPRLGIVTKALHSQTPSPFINQITVTDLIYNQGGWRIDAVFNLRAIASALNLSGPPTKWDMARYMYGEPLQYKPGTSAEINNFGYVLLGLLIEKISGKPYLGYLDQKILSPLGITDIVLGGTLRSQKLANEVSYDQPAVGLPSTNPKSTTLVPFAYGGEGWMLEAMDSAAGLLATATDMVKLIHKHAAFGIGPRRGGGRDGSLAGVSSWCESRSAHEVGVNQDGVDYAYNLNTRDFPPTAFEFRALNTLDSDLSNMLNGTPIP